MYTCIPRKMVKYKIHSAFILDRLHWWSNVGRSLAREMEESRFFFEKNSAKFDLWIIREGGRESRVNLCLRKGKFRGGIYGGGREAFWRGSLERGSWKHGFTNGGVRTEAWSFQVFKFWAVNYEWSISAFCIYYVNFYSTFRVSILVTDNKSNVNIDLRYHLQREDIGKFLRGF